MMIYRLQQFAMLLAIASITTGARANEPATVTASGSKTIEELPQRLRATLTIQAKNTDAAAAISSLTTLTKNADEKLKALGADMAATKWGDPLPAAGVSDRQQQMIMMMQRMRGNSKIAKRIETPEVVVIGSELSAEWPLEAQDSSQLMLDSIALTKKIRDAKLGGDESSTLSAEEQELLEEAAEMGNSNGEETPPGEAKFAYVSTISDEAYSAALAEAFAAAKHSAQLMAEAAGTKLGALQSIASSAGPMSGDDEMNYYAMAAYRQALQGQQPASEGTREAASPQPGKVRYIVTVNLSFYLE